MGPHAHSWGDNTEFHRHALAHVLEPLQELPAIRALRIGPRLEIRSDLQGNRVDLEHCRIDLLRPSTRRGGGQCSPSSRKPVFGRSRRLLTPWHSGLAEAARL